MKTILHALSIIAFAASATACAGTPDPQRATVIDPELAPNYAEFKSQVDPYLENRCAMLDCHGQPGRGYRIYSQKGLRLYDPELKLVSGKQATTEDEIKANYDGLLGLEPEQMRRVLGSNGEDPLSLLLLRKPTLRERHKGGQVMAIDDAGYRCITEWLKVRGTALMSDNGHRNCGIAKAL